MAGISGNKLSFMYRCSSLSRRRLFHEGRDVSFAERADHQQSGRHNAVAATMLCQPTQPGYVFTAAGFVSGTRQTCSCWSTCLCSCTTLFQPACVVAAVRFGQCLHQQGVHLEDSAFVSCLPSIRSAAALPAGACGFDTPLRTLTQEM